MSINANLYEAITPVPDKAIAYGQAELTTLVADRPFTICGDEDTLRGMANEIAADDARRASVARSTPEVGRIAVVAPNAQPEGLDGRRATITAKMHDLRFGSHLYEALKQKRSDDRDLHMATRLGLISLEDVSCRKHSKAIAKLHNL